MSVFEGPRLLYELRGATRRAAAIRHGDTGDRRAQLSLVTDHKLAVSGLASLLYR